MAFENKLLTVLHEVVVVVLVEVVVVSVVVDSSRHPHQPGVLQVSVLVRLVVDVELGADEMVDSVPLLSKNSQG